MTTDEDFDDFDEFDDEFDEQASETETNVVADDSTAHQEVMTDVVEQEFVIVDNQITDYLDVVSEEPAPALFALPQTGEARVDDAIARLGDLANLPVNDHVEIFEDVHRRLHETLADLASS